MDAESSCRKDNLGLLVNLDSLTKDTTFDLEVSITDSDQYWTGRYRLGLFYWKYGMSIFPQSFGGLIRHLGIDCWE